jgi:hypothetical protein
MKKTFVLLLSIVCTLVYGQTGFYFHPELNYKFDINNNGPVAIRTTQGFVINQTPNNFTAERTLFIGAMLGYRSKFWYLESGCIQDKWASGITFSAKVYDANAQQYKTQKTTFYGGQSFYKIPLRLGIKLWGADTVIINKKWRWQGFLELSINQFILGGSTDSKNATFIVNPSGDVLTANYYSSSTMQQTKAVGLLLKAYNKKGRNINFSLNYNLSNEGNIFHTPSPAGNIITLANYDKALYRSFAFSYGSGIYLGISTDIYLKRKLASSNNNYTRVIEPKERVVHKKERTKLKDTLPHKGFQLSVRFGGLGGSLNGNIPVLGKIKVHNQGISFCEAIELGYAYKNWSAGITFQAVTFNPSPKSVIDSFRVIGFNPSPPPFLDTTYKKLSSYTASLNGFYIKKYFMPFNIYASVKAGVGKFTFNNDKANVIIGETKYGFAWDVVIGKEFLFGKKKRLGWGVYIDLYGLKAHDDFLNIIGPHNNYWFLGPGAGVNLSFH